MCVWVKRGQHREKKSGPSLMAGKRRTEEKYGVFSGSVILFQSSLIIKFKFCFLSSNYEKHQGHQGWGHRSWLQVLYIPNFQNPRRDPTFITSTWQLCGRRRRRRISLHLEDLKSTSQFTKRKCRLCSQAEEEMLLKKKRAVCVPKRHTLWVQGFFKAQRICSKSKPSPLWTPITLR